MRKVFRVFLFIIIVSAISFYAVNNYRLIIQIFNEEETTKKYLKTVIENEVVINRFRDSLGNAIDTLKSVRLMNDRLNKINIDQGIKIKHLSNEVHVLSDSLRHAHKHYAKGVLQPVE